MDRENPLHKLLTTAIVKKKDLEIIYENRPYNQVLSLNDIKRINKGSMTLYNTDLLQEEPVQIPFHRIISIRDGKNIVYQRRV